MRAKTFSKIFILFLLAPLANAATYYVSPNGNDANPGTLAQPFLKPQTAVILAQPGDTIYLRGGTYTITNSHPACGKSCWSTGNIDVFFALSDDDMPGASPDFTVRSGTAAQPITISSYPGERAILNATGMDHIAWIRGESYWIIQNITGYHASIEIWGGDQAGNTHDIIIQYNEFAFVEGAGQDNIGIIKIDRGDWEGSYNIFIDNNVLHDLKQTGTASWQNTGSYLFGAVSILSCGEYVGAACGGTRNIFIRNNSIYNVPRAFQFKNSAPGPMVISGNGIANANAMGQSTMANVLFERNVVFNVPEGFDWGTGARDKIYWPNSAHNWTIRYNTFAGMNTFGSIPQGVNHTITNNVIQGNPDRAGSGGRSGCCSDDAGYLDRGFAQWYTNPDYWDPNDPAQSPIASIRSDNNCFVVQYADFMMLQRGLIAAITGQGDVVEEFNITQARSQLGWDANSQVIVESNANNIFENPASGNYRLKGTALTQCSAMGAYAGIVSDTTPPTATIAAPTANQIFAAGTTNVSLNVTTNEAATCKSSATDQSYGLMPNTMIGIGSTIHSATVANLVDGQSYTQYVRCQDSANNPALSSQSITFSVASACQCANTACQPGSTGLVCNGCSFVAAPSEMCADSTDNNCNGVIDEGCAVVVQDEADIDEDGTVTILDITLVASSIAKQSFDARKDLNGDSQVNVFDLVKVAKRFGAASALPDLARPSITVRQAQNALEVSAVCPAQSVQCQIRRISPLPNVTIVDAAQNNAWYADSNVAAGTGYLYSVRYFLANGTISPSANWYIIGEGQGS